MENLVSSNPVIKFKSLQASILDEFHIKLAFSTIYLNLKDLMFTTKNIKTVPTLWNDIPHKTKRKEYANIFNHNITNFHLIYVDEVNFHLWLSKSRGKSKKGKNIIHKSIKKNLI